MPKIPMGGGAAHPIVAAATNISAVETLSGKEEKF